MIDTYRLISQLIRADRRGVTAVEYGIMASLIAVAIITAVSAMGTKLNDVFGGITNALKATP